MMKSTSFIGALFMVASLFSCKKHANDVVVHNENHAQSMSLTLSVNHMRVTATDNSTKIDFAWKSTDRLNLMFEQGGHFYPATAVSPKTEGNATAKFDVVVPVEVNLSASYNLYGALNATFDGNSSKINIAQTTSLVKTLAEVQDKIPFYFKAEGKTGKTVNETLHFAGSVFKIYISNETGRQINLSNAVKVSKAGANWVYAQNPLHADAKTGNFTETATNEISYSVANTAIAGTQTQAFYACVYVDPSVQIQNNVMITTTIDGKPTSAYTAKAPTNNKFEVGKCYGLKLVFNENDRFEADFTLPSMPVENLF